MSLEDLAFPRDPRYVPPARPAPQSSEAVLRLRACAKTQVAATRACLSLVDALIAKHGDQPVSGADAVRLAEALQRLEDSTAALVAAAHAGPSARAGHD
ncbi:hypothetical protein [Bordetella hinzii]|uniref:hypothetical protein n=1 Tax=Bordetella hinzii TaxID=103855 RepID=UPI0007649B32|nr:hypothetical protein [Bordetella hinzii]KXA71086.1 hypothetical protein AXA74_20500 [Bordetella hinzii LMG 13501]VEH23196.1 Uncharacterised protein [Bordetella hinzii]